MNPLEEYPHLFANGKFGAINQSSLRGERRGRIIGHDEKSLLIKDGYDRSWYSFINCTLIARPIEDMTDEEWNECHSDYFHPKDRFKSLKYDAEHRTLLLDDFLYLLSIGVYPFDQKAFKTGIVIDSRTI